MPTSAIRQLVKADLDAMNHLIQEQLISKHPLVLDMTKYLYDGGGKQLRPMIVFLASHACNYHGTEHLNLAALIELFHTATLFHDDVIDESKLRRGKETANLVWGNKASVLVGDYLYTLHIELLLSLKNFALFELMNQVTQQIGHGELDQLLNRHHHNLSLNDYLKVIEAKTSILFAAAASAAGLISNMPQDIIDDLYSYGLHLGNAFQLIDDALDYCSNSQSIGKNIGDDLADGKITIPLIHVLAHGTPDEKRLIQTSIELGDISKLPEIIQSIDNTNAIAFTKELAKQEVYQAIEHLKNIDDSVYKQALIDLALESLNRQY